MGRKLKFDQRVVLSVPSDLVDKVDAWREGKTAKSGKPMPRSEAMRLLIVQALTGVTLADPTWSSRGPIGPIPSTAKRRDE